jgi:hypothetical protein
MDKHIYIKAFIFIVCAFFVFGFMAHRMGNCIVIQVPAKARIYTESKSATNVVAKLDPNDVIYICGE